jgi:3-amino-5-hydroxybenzoate synthase
MSEFTASVLRAQLTRLDGQVRIREDRWDRLAKGLGAIPGVVPQGRDPRCDVNPHYMAMVRLPGLTAPRRLALVAELNNSGIPAFVGFPPVYRTEGYWRGPTAGDAAQIARRCPVAEEIARDCIWLHHRVLLADVPTLDLLVEAFADHLSPW